MVYVSSFTLVFTADAKDRRGGERGRRWRIPDRSTPRLFFRVYVCVCVLVLFVVSLHVEYAEGGNKIRYFIHV